MVNSGCRIAGGRSANLILALVLRWRMATENQLRYFPRRSSTHQLNMNSQNKGISDNDVNGTSLNEGAASGRGGSEASQVVIKRKPYGMLKIGTWKVRTLARSGKLDT